MFLDRYIIRTYIDNVLSDSSHKSRGSRIDSPDLSHKSRGSRVDSPDSPRESRGSRVDSPDSPRESRGSWVNSPDSPRESRGSWVNSDWLFPWQPSWLASVHNTIDILMRYLKTEKIRYGQNKFIFVKKEDLEYIRQIKIYYQHIRRAIVLVQRLSDKKKTKKE